MTEEKQLIDTNVLVYAYDSSSPKRKIAIELIEKLTSDNTAIISDQNLVEFSRIVTEKLPKKISYEEARSIVSGLSEAFSIISYDSQAIVDALGICATYNLHFFDALLAATMEKEGVSVILTENERDFRKVPWLKVINPFK